ncbi:hypothetical protein DITRI_Ditri14bG0131900 [Diplodiscus trichospermus]
MAKRARISEADRISGLPDDVLCHIISFLPLKEAIRTSILSTRWSKIFTLISNLNFDCSTRRNSYCFSFMNFVDRILFYRTGFVDKFRLNCGGFIDSYRVDGWIRYALKNSVRELDLCLDCKEFRMLPVCVFTCKTLVTLRLVLHGKCKFVLKVPVTICFPSLKILHLSGIRFPDDDSSRRLFSSCLVLEELVVHTCFLKKQCRFNVSNPTLKRLTIAYTGGGFDNDSEILIGYIRGGFDNDYEIVIDAPSLIYFKCCYLPKRFFLQNLNSLVHVHIGFGMGFNSYHSFITSNTAATDLIKGIANVQSLELSGIFAKLFLESSSIIPEFPILTCLDLNGYFFDGWERVLPHLFACFPHLEALILKVNRKFSSDNRRVTLPSNVFPSNLWSQLKTLKILSFKGKKFELKMVEYFLKNAEVLENFTIQIRPSKKHIPDKLKSEITETLLNLPKLSEKCKVLVV